MSSFFMANIHIKFYSSTAGEGEPETGTEIKHGKPVKRPLTVRRWQTKWQLVSVIWV